jgi:hypothetical protein
MVKIVKKATHPSKKLVAPAPCTLFLGDYLEPKK